MPFTIVRQDITKMKVDVIVTAANTDLAMGGGVCGAIFEAAGIRELTEACQRLAPIQTGEAVITPGFALPAKYIIHAAGPVFRHDRAAQSEQWLRSAFFNALQLAVSHRCKSIAFPLISSGIYGYPKDEALRVATAVIRDFLSLHELDIYLVVFDRKSFDAGQELLGEVKSYIDEHYVSKHTGVRRKFSQMEKYMITEEQLSYPVSATAYKLNIHEAARAGRLDDILGNLDESFSVTLLRLIDAKGKTDVEVYKRANLDRRLFSKIRSNKGYMPGKRTAIALAVALELSLDETRSLLGRAGYALSHSSKFDVIVEYFIVRGKYDIFEINEVLFHYDQPLLGG